MKNYSTKFKDKNYDLIIICNDEALEVFNEFYEDIFLWNSCCIHQH